MWTVPELVHALKNGDKITRVFEVLAYEGRGNYLKKFLDVLSSYKIRHSKFDCDSEEDLRRVCNEINREMGFDRPELLLTPENLEENAQLKEFFKLWSNALLGK